MSKAKMSHAVFLDYVKNLDYKELEDSSEAKLAAVIEIADKLKHDFGHLARYIQTETGNVFFGRPCLDNCTDFFQEEYKGTEEDAEVLECIQGIMQHCSLSLAFLKFDEMSGDFTIIDYDHVKQMKDLGYEIYIHADVTTNGDPLAKVYVELGTLLLDL